MKLFSWPENLLELTYLTGGSGGDVDGEEVGRQPRTDNDAGACRGGINFTHLQKNEWFNFRFNMS